ncbi:BRCT domain-containing protein [Anaeroselena agilis]|uniref:BRCT domain-containing protein n=1 Tax=Anaeroselena agilis TaxID=3063788 RepID=A0ABU3P1C7_9FIRM|nr:BRCT domain-containing protein [Selenomonadales bacterium 4137-cl]
MSNARLAHYESQRYRLFTSKAEVDKALHTLEGILKGIGIDEKINITEVEELVHWYYEYMNMANLHPFSEIIPLVYQSLQDNVLEQEEVNDILWLCNNFKTDSLYYDVVTSDLQRLQGMLHGILSDNEITEEEMLGLQKWLNDNEHLASSFPYDEVYSLSVTAMADGELSEDERRFLKGYFAEFTNIDHSKTINRAEIESLKKSMCLQGICSMTPDLSIKDKHYCFTGISSKITRNGFANIITALGGIYKNSISAGTDYLVIGNDGNPCWAFSCYGRKVECAVNLRKNGHKILLVHENDFWDFYDDHISVNSEKA